LIEATYPYGVFSLQNKKGHKVVSFTGNMDLRGLFTSVSLSSSPLTGKVDYGFTFKYIHEQLLLHFDLNPLI